MSEFTPTPLMLVELRKAQWRAALKGNVPMLILLGRAYLGKSGEGPQPATPQEIAAALLELQEAAGR